MSKQNKKDIDTHEAKGSPTPKPDTKHTQSNHKASDKQSWSVNIKWWRRRCVWAQVQFRQCKLSFPLLIRWICRCENHSLLLSLYTSACCHFPHLVQMKMGNIFLFWDIIFSSGLVSSSTKWVDLESLMHFAFQMSNNRRQEGLTHQWAGCRQLCMLLFTWWHCRGFHKQKQKYFP